MRGRGICCNCVCVGFRAIMGKCEGWVQVIDAGTFEAGLVPVERGGRGEGGCREEQI